MCEQLGTDPKPEEVPLDMEDFPVEIQEVLYIYGSLSDKYVGMTGAYVGKDYALLPMLFEIYEVDKQYHKDYYFLIKMCDKIFTSMIHDKEKQKESNSKSAGRKR